MFTDQHYTLPQVCKLIPFSPAAQTENCRLQHHDTVLAAARYSDCFNDATTTVDDNMAAASASAGSIVGRLIVRMHVRVVRSLVAILQHQLCVPRAVSTAIFARRSVVSKNVQCWLVFVNSFAV